MKAVPLELKMANSFIAINHRHHPPVHRDKFRVGCTDKGILVGVACVGRPVARNLCDGKTVEVIRLCSDGSKNVCSFLYSRCARIAKEMGFSRIITYILDTEDGASLRAAGWRFDAMTDGGSWNRAGRRREDHAPICRKQRWVKDLD